MENSREVRPQEATELPQTLGVDPAAAHSWSRKRKSPKLEIDMHELLNMSNDTQAARIKEELVDKNPLRFSSLASCPRSGECRY